MRGLAGFGAHVVESVPASGVARGSLTTFDPVQTCYCHGLGHWKDEYPVLRSKSRYSGYVKSGSRGKFAPVFWSSIARPSGTSWCAEDVRPHLTVFFWASVKAGCCWLYLNVSYLSTHREAVLLLCCV